MSLSHEGYNSKSEHIHPRTVNWFGISSVAMGGSNQSLFLMGALLVGQGTIPGQGTAAVLLLMVGLLMSWAATPGWTELVMMYPNRVGGISATGAEAFLPYSPILANLTGVCYWWGWVPTCGITALLAASALHAWYLPWVPIPVIGICLILFFTFINLCGIKWAMRLAMPIAVISGGLAFLSAVIPIFSGHVDWHQAFTYHLTVPFPGWFGKWTSIMAGIYLVGFAAPAYEQATSHVGEAINPNKSVPQAIFVSAAMAGLYFIVLPVVWLGVLGSGPLGGDLSSELGPTFAPLFGGAAKGLAMWFITFNMFHGILAPLSGPPRVLSQLADDGLLPEMMSKRLPSDAPWVTTLLTAAMAIGFLFIGDPIWLIAAANLTYLIGIAMPNVAVWLMRRNHPDMERPYRAPKGTIVLGLLAAIGWLTTTIFGFEQFGLKTVIIGIGFAYAGSILYAWRKMSDNRKMGLPIFGHTLHLKLTGSMILVLALDAIGYFIAVSHVPTQDAALIAMLEDIFVIVALLTIAVGLILPGMIAHTAVEISNAAEKLAQGTLTDFRRAMQALAAGDLEAAKAEFKLTPVMVHSHDEMSDMASNFNKLQEEIGYAAIGLEGARKGLLKAQTEITDTNERLRLTELERMRNEHAVEKEKSLRETYMELQSAHDQLKQIQLQLLQSEKMASIGQLAAGVAHEINNPVGFISNNMEILQEYVGNYIKVLRGMEGIKQQVTDGDLEKAKAAVVELKKLEEEINLYYMMNDVNKLLEHSSRGLERIRKIVLDLKTFAREESAESMELIRIEEVMDSILSIVHSELKQKGELLKEYGNTPLIKGNAQRLGQVFINLLVNATQAIEDKGKITIKTYQQDGYICLDVSDTGKGIPEENLKKIFDPFFTTKPVGQGTGLGLSVSHEIIKKHGGKIMVQSKVGTGTTFTVMLPLTLKTSYKESS